MTSLHPLSPFCWKVDLRDYRILSKQLDDINRWGERRSRSINHTKINTKSSIICPRKKRRIEYDQSLAVFRFKSSNKIYQSLAKTLSSKIKSKILLIISEYAASDGHKSCSKCGDKFYYVKEDVLWEEMNLCDEDVVQLSGGQWFHAGTRSISDYNPWQVYSHRGLYCPDCSPCCIECNRRRVYNTWWFRYHNDYTPNSCSICNASICNRIQCKLKHISRCGPQIHLFQINDYDTQRFQQNILRIFSVCVSRPEYRLNIKTYDGYYPFRNHGTQRNNECSSIESKQCHNLNKILTQIIGDILSNDITLLISQYGFGTTVKCHLCHMKHHIVSYPTPNTLLLSPNIYKTVMLKQFRPKPIWICKPLYFDGIKPPILSCITQNRLIECTDCFNYASIFKNDDEKSDPKCHDCSSKSIVKCGDCDQYPLFLPDSGIDGRYTNGPPAFECYNCGKYVCSKCKTRCERCTWRGSKWSDYRMCVKCKECTRRCRDCNEVFHEEDEEDSDMSDIDYNAGCCERCLDDVCQKCLESRDIEIGKKFCEHCLDIFECNECGTEYELNRINKDSFGDDTAKLCDGCGNSWVCIKCNSLERVNENGSDKYYCNDCDQDDETYIDEIDFKRYQSAENEDIDIEQEFFDDLNDNHGYTTMSMFHPI